MAKEKIFRHVKLSKGVWHYKGNALPNRWVQFTREKSDGYHIWQAGQKVEWPYDGDTFAVYLEDGVVVPCDPPGPPPKKTKEEQDKEPKGFGLYRFLESVAMNSGGFAKDAQYVLHNKMGMKYVERGICVFLKEVKEDGPEMKTSPRAAGVRVPQDKQRN